ncbi:hypothetical protein, partial [Xylella fastidiosa]|uniref:hypothetical protein n=1 Tax=Xylella fastidiosa TaxID=2371 RepID=UPI00193100BA
QIDPLCGKADGAQIARQQAEQQGRAGAGGQGDAQRRRIAMGIAPAVDLADKADLSLIDEVAAYDSALWYLGRIGCARKIHCSPEGEAALQA